MSRPVVGITTYGKGKDPDRYTLPMNYVEALRRAGADVLMVGPVYHETSFDWGWLDRLDGMVFAGGGDIAPELYGNTRGALNYGVDEGRDAMEMALVHELIARRLPTLAICRGMQVVNCTLGGTLHQHLPDVVGETVLHRKAQGEPVEHALQLEEDCVLAQALGTTKVVGASMHHQAVDKLGEGLRPVGRSKDGVIEAMELAGHSQLWMVQWHPEITAAQSPQQQRLFDKFVVSMGAAVPKN